LGVKTFFNNVGPMVNPAFPKELRWWVCFNLSWPECTVTYTKRPIRNLTVLHALDGYDEISLTGNTKKPITNKAEGNG